MTTKQIARAKINLCLHVVGQRGDGYHLLDSIVGFAEFGDVLTFDLADTTTLTIDGPFADGLSGSDDNLIVQAARCFSGRQGATIHLEKNLPVSSGIGAVRLMLRPRCGGCLLCGTSRCLMLRCS